MGYGLIAQGGDYSFIRRVHSQLGDYDYKIYTVAPYELRDFLKATDFEGLNVAEPYKEAVLPMCDEISPEAESMRCVNLVVRSESGKLIGHNTDCQSMLYMLDRAGIRMSGKKVLIYGSSGNSSAAYAASKYLGAREIVRVNWREPGTHNAVRANADTQVVVNAVRVGMNPGGGQTMINLDLFPGCEAVAETSFSPMRSTVMINARDRGINFSDPINMLAARAKYSAEIFTGRMVADERIRKIARSLRRDMSNIVLIGMPGSGKTALGKYLSQKLGRGFLDVDTIIEQRSGTPVAKIIDREGEPSYHDMEAKVISTVGRQAGKVISVSAGAVLAECNYYHLKKNGVIIFVDRAISKLQPSGRAPTNIQRLQQLYMQRLPRFMHFADCTAENNLPLPQAGDKLLETFFEHTDNC